MGVTSDQKPSGKSTHKLTRERTWPYLKSHNKRLTGWLLQVALKCSNCLWAHPGRRGSLTCSGILKFFNDITAPFMFAPLPVSFFLFLFSLKDGTIRWWPGASNPPAPGNSQTETQKKVSQIYAFSYVSLAQALAIASQLFSPFHAYIWQSYKLVALHIIRLHLINKCQLLPPFNTQPSLQVTWLLHPEQNTGLAPRLLPYSVSRQLLCCTSISRALGPSPPWMSDPRKQLNSSEPQLLPLQTGEMIAPTFQVNRVNTVNKNTQ